ncbi:hypothetical protein [Mucisphaera sp.]|uniref:hypothetical protein n=1 Tax=Mucisphaera sp. TaxID=2913024 RepID=UPI003D09C292
MRTLSAIFLAALLAALPACESGPNLDSDNYGWVPRFDFSLGDNVSDEPRFRVGYVPGETYVTQQTLVMTKPEGWNGPIHLIGYGTLPGEATVAEVYADNPEAFDHFRGLLEEGTTLEIKKLVRFPAETEEIKVEDDDDDTDTNEAQDDEDNDDDKKIVITRRAFVQVRAEITSGPLAGKTVILDQASREDDFPKDSTGYLPDDRVMVRAD